MPSRIQQFQDARQHGGVVGRRFAQFSFLICFALEGNTSPPTVPEGVAHYHWQCPQRCLPAIDTEVAVEEQLDDLQPDSSGTVEFNATHFFPPMTKRRIATARVFMAQILYHFIECSRGACYNSLYLNVLVPHLDAVEVLDYVLRSSVIGTKSRVEVGKSSAQIFPELRARLQGVQSGQIRTYLADNFSGGKQ